MKPFLNISATSLMNSQSSHCLFQQSHSHHLCNLFQQAHPQHLWNRRNFLLHHFTNRFTFPTSLVYLPTDFSMFIAFIFYLFCYAELFCIRLLFFGKDVVLSLQSACFGHINTIESVFFDSCSNSAYLLRSKGLEKFLCKLS
ncbi:hypothetical protein AMTRI_Chr12g273930 [Amborella trichopoda]